jgi:predicted amidohydrolase YtcJ
MPDGLPDGELPTAAELDRASGPHPVLLISRDRSRALANGTAMARAKVTDHTPDPAGGRIDRDAAGSPTGLFRGEAVWGRLITGVVPPRNRARERAEIDDALADLAARGITEIHDIGTVPETDTRPAFFRERSFTDITLLTERGADRPVRYSFRASLLRAGELTLPDLPPLVAFAGYKMSLDNGWYSAGGGGRPESFRWPGFDEALRLGEVADGDGQPVSIHAMGDLGVDEAVALLASLPSRLGSGLPPHRVIHARRIGRDAARRCAAAGIVVETQPWEIVGSAERLTALGDAAFARRLSPYRDLLDDGVLVAFGSDRRLGLRTDQADTDPLTGIQIAVTRSHPEITGPMVWQPDQAITLTEAVACHTRAGAIAAGAGATRGRIAPGCAADLVVLGADPWAAPADRIAAARPVLTICAGRIRYQAAGLT